MDTALTQKELEEMLDAAVREVTESTTGLTLSQGGEPPDENSCTVHIAFKKGFRSSLSMRADTAMLASMTKNAIREEQVTPQDLEDFAKEYFNVPTFQWGEFEPKDQRQQFALNYSDDQSRSAQLIHLVPKAGQQQEHASDETNNKT